jgi:hypothetical protein
MGMLDQHVADLRWPDAFDPATFQGTDGGRIFGRVDVPDSVRIVWGKLKGQARPSALPTPQALLFSAAHWTAEAAWQWLAEQRVKPVLLSRALLPAPQQVDRLRAGRIVRLQQAPFLPNDTALRFDRDRGVIEGLSVITCGPAIGHGFDVDDVMIRQVCDAINAAPKGVKSHLTHADGGSIFSAGDDPILLMLGRMKNASVDGDRGRADMHFGRYAESSPRGNLKTFLFDLAEDDPEIAGLSVVFERAPFKERRDAKNQALPPAGRVKDVLAVDWVGDPGANPTGLLSAP